MEILELSGHHPCPTPFLYDKYLTQLRGTPRLFQPEHITLQRIATAPLNNIDGIAQMQRIRIGSLESIVKCIPIVRKGLGN